MIFVLNLIMIFISPPSLLCLHSSPLFDNLCYIHFPDIYITFLTLTSHRLRNISVFPSARNKEPKAHSRPLSMIAPSAPRVIDIKRCSSESQNMNSVKVRKKSVTLEQLEDRQFRIRNSVCHVSQRDPKLDYQMSSDMLALQETSFAKKYGEPSAVIKAATIIQRSWRKHYLNRTFHRIKLETPYRTKSMTSKVKPIVTIRQISASNDNLTDDVVRVSYSLTFSIKVC